MTKKNDADRRVDLFERCLKDCKTAAEAFKLACEIEGFIECGLEPPGIVSREQVRELVLERSLAGGTQRAIAAELGLSKDSVARHIQALRKEGKLLARNNGLAESRTGLEAA